MSAPEIQLTEKMAAFVEDYQWLKSFGMDDQDIAARFDLTADALDRRLFRTGIKGSIMGSDPQLHAQLMKLIESGAEFSVADFSFTFDPEHVNSILGVAARKKLIVKVGARPNPLAHRKHITIFCAAPKPGIEPESIEADTASTCPDVPSRDETPGGPWAAVVAAFSYLTDKSGRSAA